MAGLCSRVKTTRGACETAMRSREVNKDNGETRLWLELTVDGRSNFERTKSKTQGKYKRRGRRSMPEEAIWRRWKGWCCIFGRILDKLPEAMNNASWGVDRALREVRGSRAKSWERKKKSTLMVVSRRREEERKSKCYPSFSSMAALEYLQQTIYMVHNSLFSYYEPFYSPSRHFKIKCFYPFS